MKALETLVQGNVISLNLDGRESIIRFVVIENTGTTLEVVDPLNPYFRYLITYQGNALLDAFGQEVPVLEIEPELATDAVAKHLAHEKFIEEVVEACNTSDGVYEATNETFDLISTIAALFQDDRLPGPLTRAYAILKLMGIEANSRNVAIQTAALHTDTNGSRVAITAN